MNADIKTMTRKELIQLYTISGKTFAKWISGLGMEKKRVFTPKEVQIIYDRLGEP
jgi:hypothetical protein